MASLTSCCRYFSPYPLTDSELEDSTGLPGGSASSSKIPGVNRATVRSHGRTSDLLAGGLTRSHLSGEKSILWVCDRCFKYMAEGAAWEMHIVCPYLFACTASL